MEQIEKTVEKKEKLGIAAYIWFLILFLFFSGAFRGAPAPFNLLDLSTYQGQFGTIVEGAAPGFAGKGGTGLSNLFTTVLTIAPPIMFCMGVIEVVDHYGGLKVARKLLTPILKPLMGVPGEGAVVLISNLQSSDTSLALIKGLRDNGTIDDKQQKILIAYSLPGAALIGMMITYGVLFYPYLTTSTGVILIAVILAKFIVANLMRFFLTGDGSGKKDKKQPAA